MCNYLFKTSSVCDGSYHVKVGRTILCETGVPVRCSRMYEILNSCHLFFFPDIGHLFCPESTSGYLRPKGKMALTITGFHCSLVSLSNRRWPDILLTSAAVRKSFNTELFLSTWHWSTRVIFLAVRSPVKISSNINKYSDAKTNKRISQWRHYLLQCVQVSAALTVHENALQLCGNERLLIIKFASYK